VGGEQKSDADLCRLTLVVRKSNRCFGTTVREVSGWMVPRSATAGDILHQTAAYLALRCPLARRGQSSAGAVDRNFKQGFGAMVREESGWIATDRRRQYTFYTRRSLTCVKIGHRVFSTGGTIESLGTMRVSVMCYPNPNKVSCADAVASPQKP
jgi:hypothetical protein